MKIPKRSTVQDNGVDDSDDDDEDEVMMCTDDGDVFEHWPSV